MSVPFKSTYFLPSFATPTAVLSRHAVGKPPFNCSDQAITTRTSVPWFRGPPLGLSMWKGADEHRGIVVEGSRFENRFLGAVCSPEFNALLTPAPPGPRFSKTRPREIFPFLDPGSFFFLPLRDNL